jgi:hypothetical protein
MAFAGPFRHRCIRWNCFAGHFVTVRDMLLNESCIEAQTAQTISVWQRCAERPASGGPRYSPLEQSRREKACDEGFEAVEREVKRSARTRVERLAAQDRILTSFARFSAAALDLNEDAIQLITGDFLPAGTQLARWARRFDPGLSRADIVQASRNAWTACGLQPLLGERAHLTSSILGYSLLYPYSDNYLDRKGVSVKAKLRFSARFHSRLRGEAIAAQDDREAAIWALVALIEDQYPRALYPEVFNCLVDIHLAQEQSIAQLRNGVQCSDTELLQISCAKGGSSVVADACLVRGWLSEEERRFAFEWGALLQLGDDLQDVHEDLERGSATLFTRAARQGRPLDSLVTQLLSFSESVADRMDHLPDGTSTLRELLRMSWRSLILGAVANAQQFFSAEFLEEAEGRSPFRFAFLRARHHRLARRRGLFPALFDAFLEVRDDEKDSLPLADRRFAAISAASAA